MLGIILNVTVKSDFELKSKIEHYLLTRYVTTTAMIIRSTPPLTPAAIAKHNKTSTLNYILSDFGACKSELNYLVHHISYNAVSDYFSIQFLCYKYSFLQFFPRISRHNLKFDIQQPVYVEEKRSERYQRNIQTPKSKTNWT